MNWKRKDLPQRRNRDTEEKIKDEPRRHGGHGEKIFTKEGHGEYREKRFTTEGFRGDTEFYRGENKE